MTKAIQLYEMVVVRHGLMIVGLPFAGKTAVYRTLAAALGLMETRGQEGQRRAEYFVINPKVIAAVICLASARQGDDGGACASQIDSLPSDSYWVGPYSRASRPADERGRSTHGDWHGCQRAQY